MSAEVRLVKVRTITGRLVVETGLRIGASQETMEISGLDNPIIRNPANGEPFIPGSSLKGRMRSLAEWYFGELPHEGDVTKPIVTSQTARVFGIPARDPRRVNGEEEKKAHQRGPTRLIVRDAPLSEESRKRFKEGVPITEIKSENSINRLTSVANPRPMERVLPGVSFDVELVYRVFDVDRDGGEGDDGLFSKVLLKALALLQADALGGGSSRGNGKVRFENLCENGRPITLPELRFEADPGGSSASAGQGTQAGG
ncbi:MAG TPA: type III-A CRISPR-associated RAMP protein Csm3 [Planctomycetes bacterium]|nr:type III-A CRISPR-associated RAMP protein Csm3 [Planctomycetota bacterium]